MSARKYRAASEDRPYRQSILDKIDDKEFLNRLANLEIPPIEDEDSMLAKAMSEDISDSEDQKDFESSDEEELDGAVGKRPVRKRARRKPKTKEEERAELINENPIMSIPWEQLDEKDRFLRKTLETETTPRKITGSKSGYERNLEHANNIKEIYPELITDGALRLVERVIKEHDTRDRKELLCLVCEEIEARYGTTSEYHQMQMKLTSTNKILEVIDLVLIMMEIEPQIAPQLIPQRERVSLLNRSTFDFSHLCEK